MQTDGNLKSLYSISWQVDEDTYRKDPSYSQSVIGRFDREGFDSIDTLYEHVDTPQLRFGSLVDCLVTGDKKEFNDKYFVVDLPKTTESLENISRTLFKKYHKKYKTFDEIPDDELNQVGIACEYYANPRYDKKRLELIKANCKQSYELMFIAKDREIISSEELSKAMKCLNALKDHEIIGKYILHDTFAYPGIEHYYQLKFKIVEDNIPLKCMADIIVVNHNNKTVQPIDLKTTGHPEHMFYKSFIKWRYWIQAQLYWHIIRKVMDADDFYKNYELLDYKFIVVYTEKPSPLLWTYNDTKNESDIRYGRNGQILCRHWKNIVKELDFYMNNHTEHPMEIKEDNDIISWLNKE